MISHEGTGSYILISCRRGRELNSEQRKEIEMISKIADEAIYRPVKYVR